jgi:hypothetical protein
MVSEGPTVNSYSATALLESGRANSSSLRIDPELNTRPKTNNSTHRWAITPRNTCSAVDGLRRG